MVKKLKGIKVSKQLQEKFKFDEEGKSVFGSSASDSHELKGHAGTSDTHLEGNLRLHNRIADALFGLPRLDGVTNATELQELVTNAADFDGFMIYLTTASAIAPFLDDEKIYFCENGTWHPSPFLSTQAEADTDGDGVVDSQDAFPSDPNLTFTATRQHRFFFWAGATTAPYITKNLSSANGHLQFSKYAKLSANHDWSTQSNDGGHGWPAGDGTYNYTTAWNGYALNSDWWKFTDFDTMPDDNVYTMDLDLPDGWSAGYGVNMIIGNEDISADPATTWAFSGGSRTAQNPDGYLTIRPYPEMIDELDSNGDPTGLKTWPHGGRLKIQLKHALDDKIYIRIAHGATEADIDIESKPWIDSDVIDADYDWRPIPYDQFPADGSDWVDQDGDGMGPNAEAALGTLSNGTTDTAPNDSNINQFHDYLDIQAIQQATGSTPVTFYLDHSNLPNTSTNQTLSGFFAVYRTVTIVGQEESMVTGSYPNPDSVDYPHFSAVPMGNPDGTIMYNDNYTITAENGWLYQGPPTTVSHATRDGEPMPLIVNSYVPYHGSASTWAHNKVPGLLVDIEGTRIELAHEQSDSPNKWFKIIRNPATGEFDIWYTNTNPYSDGTWTKYYPIDGVSDFDGDGVDDSQDAFPTNANETTDTDGDGIGDNTDDYPSDPALVSDWDGDGVDDAADPDPAVANETTDSDGDGVPDTEDPFTTETSPTGEVSVVFMTNNTTNLENDPIFEVDASGDVMIDASPSGTNGNFELDEQGDVMPASS